MVDESLGVVVLAYGGGGEFEALIESLFVEQVPAASILVVHNPAVPGEPVPAVPPGCEVIQAERNLGYAGGMNLGISRLRRRGADPILLLTHDARLRPGSLEALLQAARRQPELGILGPVLVLSGTEVPFSYGGMTGVVGANVHLKSRPALTADGVIACDWVDGGTILIRAAVLEAVGGFDERFWGYCEEADLCLRARRAGYAVGVVLAAKADQAPGGTKRLGAWAYLTTRNGIEYARRAVGLIGLFSILARSVYLIALNLLRTAIRAVGLRSGGPAEPWTLAVGISRGTLDFCRGRWGPPPQGFPGRVISTMPEHRPRILQMGPDPSIGGGMAAAMRGLLSSPLAERYELEVVPTYRGPKRLPGLGIYCLALARLSAWSLRGRGRIVHIHATVRGSTYRKSLCVLLAKALRRRVVLHVHSGAGDVAEFAASRDRISLALFRAGFSAADAVIAVSAATAEALKDAYGLSGVEVVPNAVALVSFTRREENPITKRGVGIAYLGGFANAAKGGDTMLEALALALARESRLRVTLAGPGELPDAATQLIARHPSVSWVGWLGPEAKDQLMRGAEIFAISSRSEGLPMALLEAMAYEMAIVATEVGGIPEVVSRGEEGLLVPADSPEPLADALCRLAGDQPLRARLALGARRRVERFDVVEVANRLDSLYASLG